MGDYIGRAGVEQVYDELLRGRDGSSDVMVDSHGSVLSYSKTQPAVPGGDLRLTIDIDLQKVAELSLGERNGAIVAMDARNGEILALVSRPSFDANALSVRVNRVDWIGLTNDPNAPLMNKAIQSQLAPGSTFKVLMSVAGLQEGIAQHLKVTCTGGWNPYGKFHRCHENHGAVDINSAIPFSCDTFYYILGDKLGIDRIFQYATRFGFGQKTGIDLPAEQPGLMPSPEWSRRYHHAEWFPDDTLNVSIGQGAVEASPIQLARIIGGIASRGHLVRPHVVFQDQLPASFRDSLLEQLPGSGEANLPIDPANWEIITDGMAAVTQPGIFHTAPRAHLDAIDFAGKTGTAQLKGHGEIRDANESATSTPNMWFVGVAPRRNPELVVAVLWQNGRSSSDAAAIAANLVAAYVEKRRRIEHNLPTDAAIQAEIGAVWAESDKTNKKGEGAVQIRAGRFFIDPKNTLSESNGN
jgi:penicillin-binding protein 2